MSHNQPLVDAYLDALEHRERAARRSSRAEAHGRMFAGIHDKLDAEVHDMAEFGPIPRLARRHEHYMLPERNNRMFTVGFLAIVASAAAVLGVVALFV